MYRYNNLLIKLAVIVVTPELHTLSTLEHFLDKNAMKTRKCYGCNCQWYLLNTYLLPNHSVVNVRHKRSVV